MPLKSTKSAVIPEVSVPTYVFGSATEALSSQPIILDPECPQQKFFTLQTYRCHAQNLASGLRQAGLKPGDKVIVISPSSIAWPIVLMGVLMAGGVVSGASFVGRDEHLSIQAREVEPSFIFSALSCMSRADVLAEAAGIKSEDIILFDPESLFDDAAPSLEQAKADNKKHWRDLLRSGESLGQPFDWNSLCDHYALALINYTSGSTGSPKGVIVTHQNLVANAVQYIDLQKDDTQGPETGHEMHVIQSGLFHHVVAQNQVSIIGPKRGVRNYVPSRLDLDMILSYVEKYRCTSLGLLPSFMIALYTTPLGKKYDLSSVRNVVSGGAPLRLETSKQFEAFMPNPECRVLQGWGMTELTLISICRSPNDRAQTDSVGELLPNNEGKVMTPDGLTELGSGQSGEVYIRSPNVTQGYYKRPEQTAATFLPDGWLRTGDLGYYDEQGRWFVSDRLQDLIWSSDGQYARPTDIENTLLNLNNDIVDVGVAPVRLIDGENKVGRAFIALKDGSSLTPTDVEKALESKNAEVASPVRLEGGVYLITKIPRLPNGKIDRVGLSHIPVRS